MPACRDRRRGWRRSRRAPAPAAGPDGPVPIVVVEREVSSPAELEALSAGAPCFGAPAEAWRTAASAGVVRFERSAVREVIRGHTEEAGVTELNAKLARVCRQALARRPPGARAPEVVNAGRRAGGAGRGRRRRAAPGQSLDRSASESDLSPQQVWKRALRGVHPRVCGGAKPIVIPGRVNTGPSPRVRGSRQLRRRGSALRGSIPRVCGGAGRYQSVPDLGSIPACAGEPGLEDAYRCHPRVHPRVCGGAS